MSPEATVLLQTELDPNEQLLWTGQPRRGIVFRGADVFMIPFSLLWGGFAIFWEVSVIRSGADWFGAIFGIPFVLVGLYIIVGRFIVDAQQRTHTLYAVTNKRVIIRSGWLSQRIKSLNLRTLSDVSMTQKADGSGTITFGPTPPFAYGNMGMSWPGYQGPPSFELIPQVKIVYNILRDAQQAA